jgi:diguanylate cyclase (GGDEF)-like protein/PAS domain S-box-containing protein
MLKPIYKLLIWLVLLLGLAGSGVASYWMKLNIDAREYQQFVSHCQEIKLKIAARLEAHEQTVLSGAVTFDASQEVTRQEWHTYVKRLLLNKHFGGIQGLGFAPWIPATSLAAHQSSIRAEGFPDYKVHPEGEREAYAPVIFIEPFTNRNLRAFGYDMYSEPVRRAAMDRARDENIVTLSGKVTLVQETDKDIQAGTLMYAPVYEKNKSLMTAALFGWVYSPFRMNDLLKNIVLATQDIHLRVYDGNNTQAKGLLYDNNADHPDAIHTGLPLVEITNDFNGTTWTLQFEQLRGANELDYSKVWITLSTGLLISILLFLLSHSYLNTRINAANMAAKLTSELQESESRFRLLADSAPVLIWLAGVDKLCYQFNQVWLDFTGRTLEQEQGNGWAEGVHADDFQHCLDTYITAFDARLPFKMEYRLRRYDGEYRWLLDTGVPRFTNDGIFLGYIGSCVDITESKQAEIKIEKSLSLLHATLESSNDAILVVDLHNTWVLYNQKFIDLWHITDEIIAAKDDNAALSYVLNQLEDANGFLHKVQELYQTPEAISFDIINFKNGNIVERHSIPQCINGKVVVGRVWSFRDITERARAERALQKECEKNLALLRNASDGIHILDTEGNLIEVSDSFCAMLGYSRDEIIGMNVTQWDAHFPAAECIQLVRQKFTQQIRTLFETRHRCKDGSIIDVEISNLPLELDGKPALFNSSRDITKRKRVENALQESQTLLQTAQRAARLGHYVLDLRIRTAIAWTNDTLFDEIFGLDDHFIRNLANLQQIIHPEDVSQEMAVFLQAFNHPKSVLSKDAIAPIEYRIIRPNDGEERWIEEWGYHSYDDNGNPIWQVGMVQDITERKHMEHALKESEIKFKTLADFAYDWEYWVGKDSKIIYMSPSCKRISDYKAEEFLADNSLLKKIVHPEDKKIWDEHVEMVHFFEKIQDAAEPAELDFRIIKKDGSVAYISHSCRPVADNKGHSLGRRINNRDITERKQAEIQLRIAATVFESQEGMFITDANKVILNVNKAFTLITGYSAAEVIGKTPRLLYSGRHDKAFYEAIWQSIQNTGAWQGEIWNQRKNGKVYPEQMSITAVKGSNNKVTHYVATLTDITERKAMEEYIHRLAFYDALTQLPNRRLLQERLKHGIELNHRTGNQMAVLMMDLDKFKAVNDSLGHAAGDELLQQVAERVKARLREVDMVARLGGDEFVILLENISHYEDVAHVAQSIIDTLSQPFTLCHSHKVFISASIGIGICPHHGNSVETLLDNADAALYHAKDQGRGCFAYFSETLTKKTHERLALEARLHNALEQQELGLYFQPQIEISSGQLVGAETLVYWDEPDKGYRVMLKDFIALVEETEVYVAISAWALQETCKQGRQWLDEGLPPITLTVNVSPYQFRCCDMKGLVTRVLDNTGFPANCLGLGITETGLMANQDHALFILNSLDEQSVYLAIDSFGTGYSSLAQLKYFPIDILKIDKTFIKNIPFSQDDNVITTTIIDMAHHLGFKVLAEGVETHEQLAFLRLQGCDRYQGHLYSNALSASDFAKLLLDVQSG